MKEYARNGLIGLVAVVGGAIGIASQQTGDTPWKTKARSLEREAFAYSQCENPVTGSSEPGSLVGKILALGKEEGDGKNGGITIEKDAARIYSNEQLLRYG